MLRPKSPRRAATPEGPDLLAGDAGAGAPNDQEITVSALAGALKRTIEDRFGYVRVRGEISNYRGPHSSGHAYFSLKDDGARIDAVIWKTAFARMKIKPEEGLEVIASGKLTTFPGKSAYQIVIETLEPAGVGALMAALEERRLRLAAEGLFEQTRKRPLPYLPGVVGVITSPTGAVIRDILHRIAGRFPRRVIVWPVRVQGETSAAEVTRAILGFNALAGHETIPVPDVLIVARGGGSLEDLWGFNDEALVRAAAGSAIPLISAVGHETDWTLIDHAADLRAPTPTGAAELAVPVLVDLVVAVDRLEGRQRAALLRLLEERRAGLRAAARVLRSGTELLAGPRQRLDLAGARLPAGLRTGVDGRRLVLARIGGRLAVQAPGARMARMAQHLDALSVRLRRAQGLDAIDRARRLGSASERLKAAFAARLQLSVETDRARRQRLDAFGRRLVQAVATGRERRTARLSALAQVLAGLSYRSVLNRGFALVRDRDGNPVRSALGLAPHAPLSLEFADGRVGVDVADRDTASEPRPEAPRPRARARTAAKAPGPQGSLF